MEVNLDGLRTQLTHAFNTLSRDLDDAIGNGEIESFRQDDIIENVNAVGQLVGMLNCCYDDENDSFNELFEKISINIIEE